MDHFIGCNHVEDVAVSFGIDCSPTTIKNIAIIKECQMLNQSFDALLRL